MAGFTGKSKRNRTGFYFLAKYIDLSIVVSCSLFPERKSRSIHINIFPLYPYSHYIAIYPNDILAMSIFPFYPHDIQKNPKHFHSHYITAYYHYPNDIPKYIYIYN